MAVIQPFWILENSHAVIFAMFLWAAVLLSIFFFPYLTANYTLLTAVWSLLSVLFFNLPNNTFIQFSLPPTSLYPGMDHKEAEDLCFSLMMGEGPDPPLDISLDPPSPSHIPQLPSPILNNYLKGELISLLFFTLIWEANHKPSSL